MLLHFKWTVLIVRRTCHRNCTLHDLTKFAQQIAQWKMLQILHSGCCTVRVANIAHWVLQILNNERCTMYSECCIVGVAQQIMHKKLAILQWLYQMVMLNKYFPMSCPLATSENIDWGFDNSSLHIGTDKCNWHVLSKPV